MTSFNSGVRRLIWTVPTRCWVNISSTFDDRSCFCLSERTQPASPRDPSSCSSAHIGDRDRSIGTTHQDIFNSELLSFFRDIAELKGQSFSAWSPCTKFTYANAHVCENLEVKFGKPTHTLGKHGSVDHRRLPQKKKLAEPLYNQWQTGWVRRVTKYVW